MSSATSPLNKGPEWRVAIILLSLQLAYIALWVVAISSVLLGDADIRLLNIDISNAVRVADPLVIVAVYLVGTGLVIGLALAVRRSRWTLLPVMMAYLTHVSLWVLNTSNPYYKGEGGYGMIIVEVIVIAMLVSAMTRHRKTT